MSIEISRSLFKRLTFKISSRAWAPSSGTSASLLSCWQREQISVSHKYKSMPGKYYNMSCLQEIFQNQDSSELDVFIDFPTFSSDVFSGSFFSWMASSISWTFPISALAKCSSRSAVKQTETQKHSRILSFHSHLNICLFNLANSVKY